MRGTLTIFAAALLALLLAAFPAAVQTDSDDWSEPWFHYSYYRADVITVGGEEYALAAGSEGLWYRLEEAGMAPYPLSDWQRPNLFYYPPYWMHAWIHDAAFYWPPEGSPSNPEGQYYVVLGSAIRNCQMIIAHPGLYRWNEYMNEFDRMDELMPVCEPHDYTGIYRNIGDPNVLYVAGEEGIFKLWGRYGNEHFEKLPGGLELDDLPVSQPLAVDNPKLPYGVRPASLAGL